MLPDSRQGTLHFISISFEQIPWEATHSLVMFSAPFETENSYFQKYIQEKSQLVCIHKKNLSQLYY